MQSKLIVSCFTSEPLHELQRIDDAAAMGAIADLAVALPGLDLEHHALGVDLDDARNGADRAADRRRSLAPRTSRQPSTRHPVGEVVCAQTRATEVGGPACCFPQNPPTPSPPPSPITPSFSFPHLSIA